MYVEGAEEETLLIEAQGRCSRVMKHLAVIGDPLKEGDKSEEGTSEMGGEGVCGRRQTGAEEETLLIRAEKGV